MKALLNLARPLCASVLLVLGTCGMSQSLYLASYDRDNSSSTRAIETARDDAHRASAYTLWPGFQADLT